MDRRSQTPSGITADDSATVTGGVTRALFRERQVVRAADLEAEQAYLVAMRRRHHTGAHGWGVVAGLTLRLTADGLVVCPGMAVDGYGRELFIESPLALPPDAFERLGSESVDVWLFYDRVAETEAQQQRGRFDCGAGQANRWREQSRLRLTPARKIDPRRPVEVSSDDIPFTPDRTSPDDSATEWPVLLGTIRRTTANPHGYEILPATIAYATLAGETVNAPSGRARVQIGSELESDTRRFAVFVADETGKLVERLAIDEEGKTIIAGNTTLGGQRLLMREHLDGDGAACALNFLPLAAAPQAAAPWQVYRTEVKENGGAVQQLRFEIGNPGDKGDQTLSRLSIGTRDATTKAFTPCVTLSADCTLTINGKLKVEGQIIEGAVKPDANDPRFVAALSQQWARGVVSAEKQMDALFGGVNTGELGVLITDLKSQAGQQTAHALGNSLIITPQVSLLCTFRVTNNGAGAITDVQLYANVTFNEATTRAKLPATPFNLEAGRAQDVSLPAFDPRGIEGVIEISITAIGVGAQPNVLAATDSASVTVINPPAIIT